MQCTYCGGTITKPAPEVTEVVVVEDVTPKRKPKPKRRRFERFGRFRRPRRRRPEYEYEDDFEHDRPHRRSRSAWPIMIPFVVLGMFFLTPCLMCSGVSSLPFFAANQIAEEAEREANRVHAPREVPRARNVNHDIDARMNDMKQRQTDMFIDMAEQSLVLQIRIKNRKLTDDEVQRQLRSRKDGWGSLLRYEKVSDTEFKIVSAGPDKKWSTADDISKSREFANELR